MYDQEPLLTPLGRVEPALLDAVFLSRPHRFAIRAHTSEGEVEAHLADPGRLTHLLQPGALLKLDGPFSGRKTTHSAILVQASSGAWVSLVSQWPNRLFVPLLQRGHLPALWQPPAAFPTVRREVRHGKSRLDFALDLTDETTCYVETKSVTWAQGDLGLFPDAPTKRGTRHVLELTELAQQQGTRCAVVFIAQRDDVTSLQPARSIDPDFAQALQKAERSGVQLIAVSVRITPEGIWFAAPLPIEISSTP